MKPELGTTALRRRRRSGLRILGATAIAFVALGVPYGAGSGRASPAPAEVSSAVGVRWPIAPEAASVELSGIAPAAEFELRIPVGWEPATDGELVLHYAVASLVESSAIGVALNGEFVDGVALDGPSGSVAIALPVDGFKTGTNTVRVDATIDVLDDRVCPDPHHPARVLTLDATSGIAVTLAPTATLTLADLPGALEPLGLDDRTLTIRFGPSPTTEDLSAAAAVAAAVRGSTDLDVDIVIGPLARPGGGAGPEVVIGLADDLAAAGFDVSTVVGGSLRIDRTVTSSPRLVISGTTPSDVLGAARSIGAAPRTSALVGIEPADAPEPAPAPERFQLSDLGYPDRDLGGYGVVSTVYGFDAPIGRAPTSMTVTVDAVRSASGSVSGLSVLVNGSRVGTAHFDIDTGATSGVQLNVSSDDLRPGRNFLQIVAEFPGPPEDCDQRPPDESVEVSASTAVELVTNEDSVPIDLEDLPYLFRAPTDSASLVVVPPIDPTNDDLADAIDVAVTFGDEDFPARIVRAGELDVDDLVGQHVIALGEPSAQPLHELIENSIVRTQPEAADSELSGLDTTTKLNGVIEVVPNPSDPTRAIMMATGFDPVGADLAQHVLLEPALRGQLYGRATFMGGDPADPLMSPVLEPVRIERAPAETAVEEDGSVQPTSSTGDDEIEATVDEGTVFDVATPDDQTVIGSVPLGAAGLLAAGGLVVAGVVYAVNRRRRGAAESS